MSMIRLLVLTFIISFIGNALPFFGVSYTAYAALMLLSLGRSIYDIALTIVTTAVGATLAKNTVYTLGYALKRSLRRTSAVKLVMALSNKASFRMLIIILAAIPGVPLDDYLYISAGAAMVKPLPLNVYVFLGKLLKSSVEIPIELALFSSIYEAFRSNIGLTEFQIVMAVVFTVLAIVMFKVDWVRIYIELQGRIRYLPRIEVK